MIISIIKNSFKNEKVYLTISIIISIALWKVISMVVGKAIIIPSPEKTVLELVKIIKNPDFLIVVFHTMKRIIVGFSITLILAVILGVLSGLYKPVYYLLKPIVTTFKAVPTMAVIIVAIIWLSSEKAPMLVGALIAFPLLYQNVVQGIINTDENLVEMSVMFEFGKIKTIKNIYIPSIKPYLFAAISTASGLNVKIVIAAEVLSQPYASIGTCFQMERANLNTAGVFAWAIVAIVIVIFFDCIVKLFQRGLVLDRRKVG
jgi:NitT/TauT family transport system permease protein